MPIEFPFDCDDNQRCVLPCSTVEAHKLSNKAGNRWMRAGKVNCTCKRFKETLRSLQLVELNRFDSDEFPIDDWRENGRTDVGNSINLRATASNLSTSLWSDKNHSQLSLPLPRGTVDLLSQKGSHIKCHFNRKSRKRFGAENVRLWVPLYGLVFNNSFSVAVVSFMSSSSAFSHSWESSEGVAGTIVIRRMWEQFTSKWIKASWINSSNYSTAARGRKAIVVFALPHFRRFRAFNRLKWVALENYKKANSHFDWRSLTISPRRRLKFPAEF